MPNLITPDRTALDLVGLASRLILGGVLLVAGAIKVVDFPASVLAVRAYKLLPYEPIDLNTVFGYGLPVVEVLVGVLLILGLFTRACGAIGGLLMAMFIFGISSAWARGMSLDCGCFGGGGEIDAAKAVAAYPWEIARDLGLLALGVWLAVRPRTAFSLDAKLFPEIKPSDFDDFAEADHEEARP